MCTVLILCEHNISKSYEQILMKLCEEVGHLDSGGDLDSFVDPCLFSRIADRA